MYNTTYICTYNSNDIFLEEEQEQLNQEEKDFILGCLYRNDILYIFEIDDFDDYKEHVLGELYEKLKKNEFFLSCMKKLANIYKSDDDKLGLVILYSFDFLYITHQCVSEFLEKGFISHEKMELLNENVKVL
jgi:hypothetical protein